MVLERAMVMVMLMNGFLRRLVTRRNGRRREGVAGLCSDGGRLVLSSGGFGRRLKILDDLGMTSVIDVLQAILPYG